jgi:hypothetical protein
MASDLNLTDEDVTAIERRLVEAKFAASIPRMEPLTGWQKEAHEGQEAKRLQRLAAAEAEEERLRRERERAAERQAAEWERNRPTRERAKIELAKIGRKIQALEVEQERLYDQARELEQEAKR